MNKSIMELFTAILILHVTGGSIGLTTGTINMIRKKGDRYHRLVGEVFFYSMITVGLSSFLLSVMHPNPFLFMIGVFTIYLASTGKRYLYLRQLGSSQKAGLIDWILAIGMLLAGTGFIVFGIFNLIKGNMFGTLFFIFGIGSLRSVRGDFKNYTNKTDIQNIWLVMHLQRMVGAYIASVTAFVVVNVTFLPSNLFFIPWLLPTVLFVPLINKWTKKYEVKKKEVKA